VTIAPRLTFVVLSYNYCGYLGSCLESILGQQGEQDFEVIVVDDASTDGSQAVAQDYASQDERMRLLCHASNQGHSATVTAGLRLARGEFIARIDCDDRYRPCFAREALRIFVREPDVGLVYGDAALIDDSGATTLQRSDKIHRGRDYKGNEFDRLLQHNFICAPTVMARRQVWLDALPIPEGLAFHDWYFTLSAARQCDFYFTSQVLAEYRVHAANLHKRIVRDRTEEPSIIRVLDLIFSECERSAELELRKRRAKRRAYAAQYILLGDKYFGLGMLNDARRCYVRALFWRPASAMRPDIARRLGATFTSPTTYTRLKAMARRAG
jgi:glycosyltransferase involved in cell wall biosynthesis